MKKITCLIIASLLFVGSLAYSQTSDLQTKKFSIGIISGLNFADMYFPNNQGADHQDITASKVMAAGFVFDIEMSENLYVRFEPMYLQKGGNIEEGSNPVNQPAGMIKSSSIEIPMLIYYTFGNTFNPYLTAGPTLGYNLKSEIEFDLTGLEFKGDMKEVTKKIDLGITFGGGVKVPIGFGIVFLEGRYVYGIINQRENGTVSLVSNIIEIDLPIDKEEDKYMNRGFQFLAGISIPF